MSIDRIKLFETVLNIHEEGKASLTASERSIIESETRDLLNSAGRKYAMMAPPGFDKLLEDLKMSENPDDAYMMVSRFLEDSGKFNSDKPSLGLDLGSDMNTKSDLPCLDKDMDGSFADDKLINPVEEVIDSKPDIKPLEFDMEPSMDKDKKDDFKEDKKDDFKEDKKDDFKEDKKDDFKEDKKDDFKKDKKDKKDLDKSDKEELLDRVAQMKEEEDKKEEDKKDANLKYMGIKDPKTASKVTVRVLPRRDILASFEGKPLFIARPKDKSNLDYLKRKANQIYGWIIYEGPKVAAKRANTTLIAGVDDDVQPVFDEMLTPEASEPIHEDGDDLVKDDLDDPSETIPDGAEFNTKETYDKVIAGVESDAEFVTDPNYDSKPDSILKGEDTVHTESLDQAADSSQEGSDVDFQSVEANIKKLYTAKAKKLAKEANEKFIKKFVKCVKLASTRMLLNYDENPYKAASMDVLANQQNFANGDAYIGMPQSDASELIEMIASTGQEDFVDILLERTAGLMKKSDEYLNDLESDFNNLNIKSVEVSEESFKSASRDNLKTAAVEGNFQVNTGRPDASTTNNNLVGGVRAAMGNTRLSKRSNALKRLKA